MSSPALKLAFQPAIGDAFRLYDRSLSSSQQSPAIPKTLCDAFGARENVFVNELQAVPLQHHLDADDTRSCHWVLYSDSKPIGSIRLVPSPHYPHPNPGDSFVPPGPEVPSQTSEEVCLAPLPKWVEDRETTLHDGRELYVKLGRLCVVKEARGFRAADMLVQAALKWAGENPGFCKGRQEEREWKGLVCIHAYEKAVTTWARNGFVEDDGMGSWLEAGLRHIGMFCRVNVTGKE